MSRPDNRKLVAVAFSVLLAMPFYLDAVTGFDLIANSGVYYAILTGLCFAMGLLIGRWWALPLLVAPVLLVWPLGFDPGNASLYYSHNLLLGTALVGIPLTSLGVLARRGLEERSRHAAPRARS